MSTQSNKFRKGYSGIFGNQVLLKNQNGRSVMTMVPYRPPKNPTPAQEEIRKRFSEAAAWAREILQDPEMQEFYEAKAEPGRSAYILAMTDYLTPPVVKEIITAEYTGQPGGIIEVDATDDFAIVQVKLRISAPDGTLIEEGDCTADSGKQKWVYTTTQTAAELPGTIVTASATDTPGHTATLSVTL